jgi:hypothetical protein
MKELKNAVVLAKNKKFSTYLLDSSAFCLGLEFKSMAM